MASQKQSLLNKKSIRLQKYLADCGIGSRRTCEAIIAQGVVTVDGVTVTQQGIKIDPSEQHITVHGERVIPQSAVYILMNKPVRVICSSSDERGRTTIHDLLPKLGVRIYNVGRLDWLSEGLLLVTNDGDLAARLTHPKHHVEKKYRVWLNASLSPTDIERLLGGVECDGDVLRAAAIRSNNFRQGECCCTVVLREGKNRHIRRMMQAVGRSVERLQRTQIGPLDLGTLEPGDWRYLTDIEVALLKKK